MLVRADSLHGYPFALQIGNAANAFVRNQLEASRMHSGQNYNGLASVNGDEGRRHEQHGKVHISARNVSVLE
jgi:hypothetical protein